MTKDRPIHYEPHPVAPERKRELMARGFRIIDARFKPADAVDPMPANVDGETPPAAGLDDMTDDELRAHVEAVTGTKPHHKAGRAKLLAMLDSAG